MIKKELIQRSPIRILEKSIHGGLGKGNLGVFTARKGTGKTACLVHVATDKLLNDQNVLHISFADNPNHIETWYKQVFEEVAETYRLERAYEVYHEIIPKRLILHFKQRDRNFADIVKNIDQIARPMNFSPQCLIVDGYPFDMVNPEQLAEWKSFARERDLEIWFSATLHREDLQLDANGIPAPVNRFSDLFSVIIMLNPLKDFIGLKLLKDHDSKDVAKLRLKLDAKTLLIANRRV